MGSARRLLLGGVAGLWSVSVRNQTLAVLAGRASNGVRLTKAAPVILTGLTVSVRGRRLHFAKSVVLNASHWPLRRALSVPVPGALDDRTRPRSHVFQVVLATRGND